MVRNGQRVILMADHSKVGQEHFVRFAGLDEIDVFVTDSGLDDEPTLEFEAAGVEVVRA
jgi:DeoR family fructose operon transcriptional repressor